MNQSKWARFSQEVGNLVKFWILGVCLFFVFRLAFVILFAGDIQTEVSLLTLWKVFKTGFRFDAMVVSYFVLLPLVGLLVLSFFNRFQLIKQIRLVCQSLFVFMSLSICIIALNYYQEFRQIFDNNLFLGVMEEDFGVVLEMIWKYKNPLLNISLWIASLLLWIWIFNRASRFSILGKWMASIKKSYTRVGVVVVLLLFFVAGLRGTFTGNILRFWDSAVTADQFLNMTVLNPFKSLELAYKDYQESNRLGGTNRFAAKNELSTCLYNTVAENIKKKAQGPHIPKPKQVFLVIMESYDAWPLLEKYRPIGISENLSRIADAGTTFMNFLPAYNATIYAYNTITTSIPAIGVNLSQVAKVEKSYVSSIYSQFKKLGYKTHFFYGGYLSWQKVGQFSEFLGCDKAYSAADMGEDFKEGCWAVEDEVLFEYILDTIDPNEYSLNVILTASNHPPYVIDVEKKGFPYHALEDLPQGVKGYFDGVMSVEALGHRWYGDYALGKFVSQAEYKYPESLFAFTGDHYGRKFINNHPNAYEESAVPFILYGQDIPAQKLATPGSHSDICPTLIELIAPKGFKYYSFGSSMLDHTKPFGIGLHKGITSEYIYIENSESQIVRMNLATEEIELVNPLPFNYEYSLTFGLAWHYVAKGNKIDFSKLSI